MSLTSQAEKIREMTPEQWQSAVRAAKDYGLAVQNGDPDRVRDTHRRALAAGCVDEGNGERGSGADRPEPTLRPGDFRI